MINTVNTTLDCTPQRFHSVNVDNTTNILFSRVLDYFVSIAKSLNVIVAREFIGKDNGLVRLLNIRSIIGIKVEP